MFPIEQELDLDFFTAARGFVFAADESLERPLLAGIEIGMNGIDQGGSVHRLQC